FVERALCWDRAGRHRPGPRQIHGQEPARTPTLPFNPALRGLPAPEPPSPGTGRKSGMHRPVRPDRWPARNPPLLRIQSRLACDGGARAPSGSSHWYRPGAVFSRCARILAMTCGSSDKEQKHAESTEVRREMPYLDVRTLDDQRVQAMRKQHEQNGHRPEDVQIRRKPWRLHELSRHAGQDLWRPELT